MQPYLDLLRHILDHGAVKADRTGTGTRSVFGHQMRFDLRQGFPLLTTKKLHVKSIIHELLWFIAGDTNVALSADSTACASGMSGRTRRATWGRCTARSGARGARPMAGPSTSSPTWSAQIRRNPDSRRLIVSAWNVGEIERMALPPCHVLFQFYVAERPRLSCQLYQRSVDVFLGLPFNIASYALLTLMVAQVCGLRPGEFIHTSGDVHLYMNHVEQARLQLTRVPRPLPQMIINPAVKSIFDFKYEDFA